MKLDFRAHKKSRDLLFLERGLQFFFVWSSNVHMNFHIDVVLWTFLSKSSIHSIHFAWEFFGSELQKNGLTFYFTILSEMHFSRDLCNAIQKSLAKKEESIQFISFEVWQKRSSRHMTSNILHWLIEIQSIASL